MFGFQYEEKDWIVLEIDGASDSYRRIRSVKVFGNYPDAWNYVQKLDLESEYICAFVPGWLFQAWELA